MGLYVGPLGIGEVGLVCSSHARYSTELLPPDYPFQTVSEEQFSEVHAALLLSSAELCRRSRSDGWERVASPEGVEQREVGDRRGRGRRRGRTRQRRVRLGQELGGARDRGPARGAKCPVRPA